MLNNKHIGKILAIIFVLIIFSLCIFYFKGISDNEKGITALQGEDIADNIAKEWNQNATLAHVSRGTYEMYDGGKFESWYYVFFVNFTYPSSEKGLSIRVFSDGRVETSEMETAYEDYPLKNWTIDSDEAYSIAMKNEKMTEYMNRYGDATVDSFYLTMPSENSPHPVWNIYFMAGGADLSPHNANISIDATTGEVIYVKADLTSQSWPNDMCCISSIVGIFVIVAAAVLLVRKKTMKEQEKRMIEEKERNTENDMSKWDSGHEK